MARIRLVRRPLDAPRLALQDRDERVPRHDAALAHDRASARAAGRAAEAERPRRAALAGALPGRVARRPPGRRPRPGCPLRDTRGRRSRVRDRPSAPARTAARRSRAARRARLPGGGGGRDARGERGVGNERAAARPRAAGGARPACIGRGDAVAGLGGRAGARHSLCRRFPGRGRRRRCRAPHSGRQAHHAARAVRVPRPGGDRPFPLDRSRRGCPRALQAGGDARERPAGVRLLPARSRAAGRRAPTASWS